MILTFTNVGQVAAVAIFPGDVDGKQTQAILSNISILGNDDAVFKVGPDPNNQNGVLVTSVAAGSGTIAALANFLDSNGASGQVGGTLTVTVTTPAPPTPITTQLIVLAGAPIAVGSPVPPVPPPAPSV